MSSTTRERQGEKSAPTAGEGAAPAADQARERPVLRFAPSPNGELHLGHALSALTNVEMAHQLGGRLLLRIEDIDLGRTRQAFVDQITSDLAWLGVAWEEPVRRQSAHFADYEAAAARLAAMGLVYPCFASRTEIEAAAAPGVFDPDGALLYPGLYRDLEHAEIERRRAAGERPAMRLNMRAALAAAARLAPGRLHLRAMDEQLRVTTAEARPERWGDVIIQRKDVPTSYHLAVVVDDALQGVTHVVRGEDLLAATDLHRLLQVLLGLPQPIYHHHRLLLGDDGRKLAKSRRDTSLRALREKGLTPADVRRMIGLPMHTRLE